MPRPSTGPWRRTGSVRSSISPPCRCPSAARDPVAGARVNVVGTVAVFEAARRHRVRRLAYASSIAAHGAPAESPYAPTLYGAYKACDEAIARTYWQDWAVPSIGLRPGIVYGVGRDQA